MRAKGVTRGRRKTKTSKGATAARFPLPIEANNATERSETLEDAIDHEGFEIEGFDWTDLNDGADWVLEP